jgi:hypothetical protein
MNWNVVLIVFLWSLRIHAVSTKGYDCIIVIITLIINTFQLKFMNLFRMFFFICIISWSLRDSKVQFVHRWRWWKLLLFIEHVITFYIRFLWEFQFLFNSCKSWSLCLSSHYKVKVVLKGFWVDNNLRCKMVKYL